MNETPKIILVKDATIREKHVYHVYAGRKDGEIICLALSLYGWLTMEILRKEYPGIEFEETPMFLDISRNASPKQPGPLAKLWSQRPIFHFEVQPFWLFANDNVEAWMEAIKMEIIFSPFNESAES